MQNLCYPITGNTSTDTLMLKILTLEKDVLSVTVYLTPQEIQRKYPEYNALIDNMKSVNKIMVKYAEWLQEIVEGNK